MQLLILFTLAVTVGVLVVIQGSLSAHLGTLLSNPLFATSVAKITGACYSIMAVLLTVRQYPQLQQLKEVPVYLWFTGGLISFMSVTLFCYVIPRVGISTAVTFGLTGQIVFAAIAGHLGWFGLPVEPITGRKVLGFIVMVSGVLLIKS